ncbi:MAG: rRNA pseudouridine synthase [Syntrophorhabdaceae bacterium]|nr:rRNA pseudouridine synthase [Syntrophorhabdaceae bacterium]HQG79092.1 pseudouridine synthase [bacterium]
MRLSKYIAKCGISSRRKSEEIIRSGYVIVNDIKILEPYFSIDPDIDIIKIHGKEIIEDKKLLYIALNKPVGYLSDLNDPSGRKLARDLIDIDSNIFPVGRLDYNSEGLIVFTNDGDFANILMHPRFSIEKEYLVKFKGRLDKEEILKLRNGVIIDKSLCKIKSIKFYASSINNNWYRVTITEGRNRIIRKIGEKIHHRVLKLKRIRIGNISLGNLLPGQYRFLTDKEIRPFKMPSI